MAQYSLAPGYIKLRYSVLLASVAFVHTMTIPIVPESPTWANLNLLQGNGTGVLWTTGINAYVTVLKALFANTCTFVDATLYRQDTPNSVPVLTATTALAIVGTNASANGVSRGDMYYFTTTGGRPVRVLLLENSYAINIIQAFSALDASQQAFVNYVKGTTSIVRGRDGNPVIVFSREVSKNYDIVRSKRLGL